MPQESSEVHIKKALDEAKIAHHLIQIPDTEHIVVHIPHFYLNSSNEATENRGLSETPTAAYAGTREHKETALKLLKIRKPTLHSVILEHVLLALAPVQGINLHRVEVSRLTPHDNSAAFILHIRKEQPAPTATPNGGEKPPVSKRFKHLEFD